jgi:hypothetical protein
MSLPENQYDEFVRDKQARHELGGFTAMTFWRWDNDPAKAPPGWEPAVKIGRHNHRRRSVIEQVKHNLMQQAIARRGAGA